MIEKYNTRLPTVNHSLIANTTVDDKNGCAFDLVTHDGKDMWSATDAKMYSAQIRGSGRKAVR